MYKKLFPLIAATLASATVLSAQTQVNVTFTDGGNIGDGHYLVGDYHGTIDGQAATLNCVDFFHEVTYGEQWTAYESNLTGNLSDTRLGSAGLQQYEESAWLVSHYKGASNGTVANIQHAVWSIMGVDYNHPSNADYFFNGPNNTLDPNAQYWVNLAEADYNNGSVNYADYKIITDIRANGPNDRVSAQEFLTTTPEPSSMALLGTGLVGLVPMIRRRKRSA